VSAGYSRSAKVSNALFLILDRYALNEFAKTSAGSLIHLLPVRPRGGLGASHDRNTLRLRLDPQGDAPARIWVDSTLGKSSTFQMQLPTRAEFRKGAP
jgi:hypothetical protein